MFVLWKNVYSLIHTYHTLVYLIHTYHTLVYHHSVLDGRKASATIRN
jgi:hypothetical protein